MREDLYPTHPDDEIDPDVRPHMGVTYREGDSDMAIDSFIDGPDDGPVDLDGSPIDIAAVIAELRATRRVVEAARALLPDFDDGVMTRKGEAGLRAALSGLDEK